MKLGEKIETSIIVRRLLIISIVISLGISVILFINNRPKFDNHKISGDYNGDFYFPTDAQTTYSIELTFDGKKEYVGTFHMGDAQYEISSSYTCIGTSIEFIFIIDESGEFFSLDGVINDSGTIIEGNVRHYLTPEEDYSGSFFISKYT